MTDFFSVIKARKSVRSYLSKPVEKVKLHKIVEAAYKAPCAGTVSLRVVTNQALITKINDKALLAMRASGIDFLVSQASIPGYRPLYGAPAVIVIAAESANPLSPANAAAAGTSATFAATALGLGSVYAVTPTLATNSDADLTKRVGLPQGTTSFVGLPVGYEGPRSVGGSVQSRTTDVQFVE
jgi:nitroreductase